MKTLMIGLDGAQVETFKRGWTPFLASLLDKGSVLSLEEDLISRGWAEIITGQHAVLTGGLYERPVLDGTYQWTEKFRVSDSVGFGNEVKPLWQVLNERGYRVGFMNVPTTNPAPEVDGFFVSGGGGGRGTAQDVLAEQCHPAAVKKLLDSMGYILDERKPSLLGEKNLYDPNDFFMRLQEMSRKRTDAFIDLSHRYLIDFGFVVYKSSIVETESLALTEIERQRQGDKNVNEEFLYATETFYRAFDDQIRRLVFEFPDSEVILVSDHGLATRRWSVNPNAFLLEKSYQRKSSSRRKLFDFVDSARHWIPFSLRKKLKANRSVKKAYISMVTFDPNLSLAFNITRTNAMQGIYVNDKKRFGGPVKESEVESLKDAIIRDFNQHPVAIKHKLSAGSHPFSAGGCSEYFPDIVLNMPDGYMQSNSQQEFIAEYISSTKPLDLRETMQDKRPVAKGHYPLAAISNGRWMTKPEPDRMDLRVVYDHVCSSFPGNGKV